MLSDLCTLELDFVFGLPPTNFAAIRFISKFADNDVLNDKPKASQKSLYVNDLQEFLHGPEQ